MSKLKKSVLFSVLRDGMVLLIAICGFVVPAVDGHGNFSILGSLIEFIKHPEGSSVLIPAILACVPLLIFTIIDAIDFVKKLILLGKTEDVIEAEMKERYNLQAGVGALIPYVLCFFIYELVLSDDMCVYNLIITMVLFVAQFVMQGLASGEVKKVKRAAKAK